MPRPCTMSCNAECLEECGLTRPCLPDDVHVRKPIGLLDADRNSFISKVCTREKRRRIVGWRCHAGSLLASDVATKTRFYALSGKFPPLLPLLRCELRTLPGLGTIGDIGDVLVSTCAPWFERHLSRHIL